MTTAITEGTVIELIRTELVDSGVEEDTITPDAKFDDLDMDSLDAAELMTTIKKHYGVMIPRAELADVTVGELAAKVAASATP